jgi:hypothetical protein
MEGALQAGEGLDIRSHTPQVNRGSGLSSSIEGYGSAARLAHCTRAECTLAWREIVVSIFT